MAHTNQESEDKNLSRIRDILFGEDLQSIEQKLSAAKDQNSASFEKLKTETGQEIAKLKNLTNNSLEQLENRISTIENNLNQTISQLKEEYKLKVEKLEKDKLDKNTLSDMLVELAKNLKK